MYVSRIKRKLEPGVYGPLPTFFDVNQEIDFVSYKTHLLSEYPHAMSIYREFTELDNYKILLERGLVSRISSDLRRYPDHSSQFLSVWDL